MYNRRPNYLKLCKVANRRPDLQAHGVGFRYAQPCPTGNSVLLWVADRQQLGSFIVELKKVTIS